MLVVAPETKVIVVTGQNDRANALRAVAMGAYDFFAKPFEPDLLALTVDRAFRLYDLQQENNRRSPCTSPMCFRADYRIRKCSVFAGPSKRLPAATRP